MIAEIGRGGPDGYDFGNGGENQSPLLGSGSFVNITSTGLRHVATITRRGAAGS